MAEQFSEAWEFYTPDAEIAELVAENQSRHERAATTDKRKFMFRFEGNSDMTAGRFFDGILFGKTAKQTPIFSWGCRDLYGESTLVRAFEKQLMEISPSERDKWVMKNALKAWTNLDDRIKQIAMAMVLTEAPQWENRGRGRRPTQTRLVAERFDASTDTICRAIIRMRIFMMRDMIDKDNLPKCLCGCGNPAPIAYVQSNRYGHDVMEPVRFIPGHNGRAAILPPPSRKVKLSPESVSVASEAIASLLNMPFFDDKSRKKYEDAILEIGEAIAATQPKKMAFP